MADQIQPTTIQSDSQDVIFQDSHAQVNLDERINALSEAYPSPSTIPASQIRTPLHPAVIAFFAAPRVVPMPHQEYTQEYAIDPSACGG